MCKVFDLPSRQELRLQEDKAKLLHIGASRETVRSSQELVRHLQAAAKRRATQKTGANAVSSRSHFVARIFAGGTAFTLVDLAGSERKKDSEAHTKARQQEGAEINASLHALKECIRAQGKPFAPYRNSPLTRVLQESLAPASGLAQLAVIATVSPSATDIEHSVSTLQVAYMLSGRPDRLCQTTQTDLDPAAHVPRTVSPFKWSHEELMQWLTVAERGRFAGVVSKFPEHVDGKALSRWTAQRCVQLVGERLGELLFHAFHEVNKKASAAQKRER